MKKYEKEVVQSELNNEKAVLKNLKRAYQEALFEVDDKIAQLLGRSDADQQHVIYQVEYQRALKKQINGILDALHTKEFETISEYLSQTYDEGFIGTLYTMQAQGVPLAFPINQELVVSAIQHETMLTSSLYTELGLSIQTLKKEIASEISRGMVSSLPYKEIARNVANRSNIPMNKAMTIARTEGHRIRETAADHTRTRARQAGADVIDFWDAALDGKTRTTHRMLDGQRRNKKGYFEANGKRARYPGDFGDPAEDVNCRCRVRSEARWALDEGDTKMLGNVSKMSDEEKQEIADKLGIPVGDLEQYSGQIVPIKAKNYDDFKQQYSKLWRYDDKVPKQLKIEFPEGVYKVKGFTPSVKKQFDTALKKLEGEYNIQLNSIVVEPAGKSDIFVTGYHDGVVDMVVNENADFDRIIARMEARYMSGYFAGRTMEDYVAHEMAHVMVYQDCKTDAECIARGKQLDALLPHLKGISRYADKMQSGDEALAEAFVRVRNGEEVQPIVKVLVDSYFGKWKK